MFQKSYFRFFNDFLPKHARISTKVANTADNSIKMVSLFDQLNRLVATALAWTMRSRATDARVERRRVAPDQRGVTGVVAPLVGGVGTGSISTDSTKPGPQTMAANVAPVSGNIDCRMIAPCGSTCTHGARTPGRCCPDCSRCAYHSRSYRDGERFVSDRDPCRSCVCKRGSVTCEVTRCPKLKCSNTHRPRDQCCPVCAPCYHGNKEWAHGSSWRLPSDPCSSCACAEGSIRCEKETCPSLSCEHPVNLDSSCCQSCDGCFYNGMTYANQAVVHSSNTCQHCQCVDGTVTCTMEHCPELSCSSHVTLPGQCCPRCSSCSHEGGNYDEGATFISRRNPCLECTCESGETDCRRIDLDCPSVTSLCRHPGRDRDECCPRCDLCEYERRNYRNGQRFHPPHASQCVSCVCTNGTVECDTEVCKSMSCSNPVVKADQCCPVCQECEADGRSHQSGDVWFQGKCTRCECVDGVTQCDDVPCPQLNCTHPVTTAQSCCSTCDMCLFDGRVFANHRQFAHPNQPCETCTCQAGSVSCQTRDCPSLSCPHPVTSLDACCPTCPTDCRVSPTLVLGSGESRTMPEDQCRTCTCTAGELRCTRRCLTTVPCSHPTDGACCRDNCDGCFYRGKHMDNGQVQPHSRNPCRTCTCVNGNVRCSRKKCQAVTCRQPAMDEDGCCPVCPKKQRSCEHGGQTRRHSVQFAEDCKLCRCEDGEVTCRPKSCPAFHCSHPVVRNCCRHCGGCQVGGSEYQSGEEVTGFSSDVCQTCRCVSGSVVCTPITCPNPTCTHPVKDPNGCCSVCNDCMYEGRRYDQGSLFNPPNDNCEECECNEGSVTCQRELCFDVTCPHAVTQPGSCCPSCGDSCSYEGEMFSNMQTFPDPSSECRTCTCDAGFVACSAKRCPPASCSNPVQGECNCSKCDDCLYNGVRRRNRETFSNPQDQQCSECYCQDGSVVCGARHCQPSTCTHPIDDPCMCPLCTKCLYFGSTYDHGDTFPDVEHSCNECTCQDGNVRCARRECPPVACQHPVMETCGCPQCTSCNYMGVEFNHLQEFPDSMNKCNKCICKSGSVRCTLVRCPATQCSKPATPIGECCPKCIGSCMADGRSYENGASFVSPLDVCSTCLCSFGSISCVREQCSRTCSHPLSTTQCCADCSGCLYQNRRFDDGLTFMHPSDLCQRCICTQGSVVCHNMHCPPLNCTNPNTVPGQCCKQCPQALSFGGCMHNGQEKEIGNRWMERDEDSCRECRCDRYGTTRCSEATCTNSCSHPVPSLDQCCPTCHHCFYGNRTRDHGKMFRPDGCHECVCKKGNVRCVTKACRPLPCPARKQAVPDGLCCPECMSCSADGKLYLDGQQWHLPDEPCVTCQCQHGIVTCRRVTCVSACHFTAPVPGQCCPVCVGCNLRGRTHEVGVPFEPNPMDPCEKCQCVVASDGSRGLACTRAPCPSLADCPRSCVRQPAPGSCCPYCASECSYGNCRSTIAGQEINPSDDPCFSCECNVNNTWICAPLVCPVLSCPTSVQYTPKGSCCAVCDTCHLPLKNKQVASGDTWSVDECRSCSCDRGTTRCEEQQCVTLTCGRDKVPYKQAGKCCEECVDPDADCVYEGHVVSPRRRWLVDKCTTCHCFAGKVNCVTKRCRMLMCNSDQVATVMPGECCPQCRPRPGQCVAFGDPHYRTFDGRMIHFQGKCKYVLAADCMHQDFRIEVKNTDHGGSFGGVSWTDEVFINVAGSRVVLDKQYRVSINGTYIKHLPFLVKPQLLIHRSGNHLIVNSEIGVYVSWNAQQSRLEVSVPGSYKRRTCGLCGNFNNFPQDDLRLRSTHIATSDLAFGNDWKVRDPTSGRCPDAVAYDPCQAVTYAQRKMANKACKVITSQTFSACHQVVSPGMYFASCVYDACACGQNDQFCVCNAVEAYAAQCRRSGVVVQWRTAHMCQIRCPLDKGYVFDECGSPCKRTCANRNLPPQVIEAQCYQPCVSGCACPAGKVEHQGRCIAPRDCPDNIAAVAVNE